MNLLTRLAGHVLEITLAMSLVIALLLALRPLLRRRYRAKLCYWIWLAAALRLALPLNLPLQGAVQVPVPAVTVAYRQVEAPPALSMSGEIDLPAPVPAVPGGMAPGPEGSVSYTTLDPVYVPQPAVYQPALTLAQLCALIWLAGGVGLLAWNLIAYARFRLRVRRWRRLEEDLDLLGQFEALWGELGAPRLTLARCPAISSPLVTGFVRPELLLPAEDFTPEQRDAIFRHELIHAKRRDLWYKLLLLAARCVHWFNPLVHLMIQQAGRDLELSCDEAVVAGRDAAFREGYSRAILDAAERGCRQAPLTSYFYGGKAALLERLKAILGRGGKRRGLAVLCALALAVAGGAAACSVGGPGRPDSPPGEAELIGYTGPVRWAVGEAQAVVLDNDGMGVLTFYLEVQEGGETIRIPFQQLPAEYGADLAYPYAAAVEARPFAGVLGHDGFVLTYGLNDAQPVEYYLVEQDSPELLLSCDGVVYELDFDNDGDAELLECQPGPDGETRLYDWLAIGGLSLEEGGPGSVGVADVNYAAARKLGFVHGAVGLEYLPADPYRPGDPLSFRCFPRSIDAGTPAGDAVPQDTQVTLTQEDLWSFCSPPEAYLGTDEPLSPASRNGMDVDSGTLLLYGGYEEDGRIQRVHQVRFSMAIPADLAVYGQEGDIYRQYWAGESLGSLTLVDTLPDGTEFNGGNIYVQTGVDFWGDPVDPRQPGGGRTYRIWYHALSEGCYLRFLWAEDDLDTADYMLGTTLIHDDGVLLRTYYAYHRPTSGTFDLAGPYAAIFDYLIDRRWDDSRPYFTLYLPRFVCFGTYERDGRTVYVCGITECFYYDLTLEDPSVTAGIGTLYGAFTIGEDAYGDPVVYDAQFSGDGEGYGDSIRALCGPRTDLADFFLGVEPEGGPAAIAALWDGMPGAADMLRTYVALNGVPLESVNGTPLADFQGVF